MQRNKRKRRKRQTRSNASYSENNNKKEVRLRAAQRTHKKQEREMQQLTKRGRRGTTDRDDTTAGASEPPSTSDIPNAVQQGTNGLPFSQQAIPQQCPLLQPSFLPPMQPAMAPPPTNMSIPWMMQEIPKGFYNTHTSPFYSSAYNDVTPQPPR